MPKLVPSLALVVLVIATGCPRLAETFDDAGDEAAEMQSESSETVAMDTVELEGGSSESDPMTDLPMDGCQWDVEGLYLLALETALGPDTPLQFVTTIDMECSIATFTLQPLSLYPGSQTEPREPFGDPLIVEGVEFDALGNFTLDLGEVTIAGEVDPIIGSEISAALTLHGHVVHVDALCGDVTGMLSSPIQYDLAGSTFAMIRVAAPDMLPLVFPYRCNQVRWP